MHNEKWQLLLNEASDPESVVAVSNEFLRTWTAENLAHTPADCRPPNIISADQIGPYAIRLIAEIGVGNRTTAPMLYAMSTFFTKAALRLAEIAAPHTRPAPRPHRTSGSSAT